MEESVAVRTKLVIAIEQDITCVNASQDLRGISREFVPTPDRVSLINLAAVISAKESNVCLMEPSILVSVLAERSVIP